MDNNYENMIFLSDLLNKSNYRDSRIWIEHQEMQMKFLLSKGLSSSSTFLDVGCGPMRLGVKVIPLIKDGWYYGVDINDHTLDLGREVLVDHGVESSRFTLLQTRDFVLDDVEKPIDIAFSNSLFSHLSMNSIQMCLNNVRRVLGEHGVYYSTFFNIEESLWAAPAIQVKWGRDFQTFPNKDPYHYSLEMMSDMAKKSDFLLEVESDFGHPTQTMVCFKPCA